MEALQAHKTKVGSALLDLQRNLQNVEKELQAHRSTLASLNSEDALAAARASSVRAKVAHEDIRAIKHGSGVCVVSESAVDQGGLSLFWDRLEFHGWRGNLTIPLSEVSAVGSGTSFLPRWAGVPLLGSKLPGAALQRASVLLDLVAGDGTQTRSVFAGLAGADWPDLVEKTRLGLVAAAESRAEDVRNERAAILLRAELARKISDCQTEVSRANFRKESILGKVRQLKDDLALPDWEQKTLELKGRNLSRQLEQSLKAEAAYGWELVSTTSPRKDEMVAALRRVRRF